ncbi:hypothetical protein AUEXF2481DRAFT_422885 [Aureobasidium subglaciale EXF-2481]|uniref:Uncharacterized protein n=1 Tax=Aureobasidium subglaciale (strain EXF-2481) TaxID=1043005 RepID=A0A074Y448_AURSE|nr:uncharacterized protein AUEXF2481DRAFT_422885 [Aureobasidium subglaciale EXF-2481]KEQ92563.1 hypothetical protein AUEXF2481DRAFT_422885 [Aureobasidium subglaciale EXF-2481]
MTYFTVTQLCADCCRAMNDAAQDVEPPVTPQPHHPNDTDRLHPAIPTYDFSEAETMQTTHALTLPGIVARDLYRAQIPADVVRLAPVPDQLLTQQLAEIDAAKNAIPVTTPQVSTTSTPSKPPTTVPEPDTPPPTYNDATTATPPPPIRVPQPSQIEAVDIRMIARITYFAWNTRENLPQLDEYVEATTKHIETKLQAMPDFSDLEIAMIQVFRIMSRVTNNAMDEYRVIVGGLATRTQTHSYLGGSSLSKRFLVCYSYPESTTADVQFSTKPSVAKNRVSCLIKTL